jgi:hypothetical protein
MPNIFLLLNKLRANSNNVFFVQQVIIGAAAAVGFTFLVILGCLLYRCQKVLDADDGDQTAAITIASHQSSLFHGAPGPKHPEAHSGGYSNFEPAVQLDSTYEIRRLTGQAPVVNPLSMLRAKGNVSGLF